MKTFADTFGLAFSSELIREVRELNPEIFGQRNAQALQTVPLCSFPNPAQLMRLKKGTGFQATSALILDPQKIYEKFFGQ